MPPETLFLFDIDGTLLQHAEKEHFEALPIAIEQVYGIAGSDPTRVDIAGRTDLEIAKLVLRETGVDDAAIERDLESLEQVWAEVYRGLRPSDLSRRVVPGIPRLLSRLRSAGARLGLLSGNLESIARLKLERAGLVRFFDPWVGAFGSDAERRGRLPRIARKRAGGRRPWPRERTVLVGDTPRDILAARRARIRCVAVATGPHGAHELSRADRVAASAGELERILVELNAGGPTA